MNHNITEAFIKTYVRKSLRDIKESPQRSTRNLVDMALNFANGRFQKTFLEAAQKMLSRSSSAYYDLAYDLAWHVDEEKILTFGMNVGYASCTLGAETIRKLEQEYHFNIPWSLTLLTDMKNNPSAISTYSHTIKQGKKMGIYTWLLFAKNHPQQLLPLIKENPDCAFVLFCHSEDIIDELISAAASLNNLMFSVQFDQNASDVCARLREKELLYSFHFRYQEDDAGMITSGGLLSCTGEYHPAFTFLIPDASCPEPLQQIVYSYVKRARKIQMHPTIPMDLVYDNRYIDSIISSDACTAAFDVNGNLLTSICGSINTECNLFHHGLSEIFKLAYPQIGKMEPDENLVHI